MDGPARTPIHLWVVGALATLVGRWRERVGERLPEMPEPGRYGNDRFFAGLFLGDDPALEQRLAALETAGHPVARFRLADPVRVRLAKVDKEQRQIDFELVDPENRRLRIACGVEPYPDAEDAPGIDAGLYGSTSTIHPKRFGSCGSFSTLKRGSWLPQLYQALGMRLRR